MVCPLLPLNDAHETEAARVTDYSLGPARPQVSLATGTLNCPQMTALPLTSPAASTGQSRRPNIL